MSNSSSRVLEVLNLLLESPDPGSYVPISGITNAIASNSGSVATRTIRRDIDSLKAIYDGCVDSRGGKGGGIRLAVGKIDLWVINRLRHLYPEYRTALSKLYSVVEAKYFEQMRM